MVARSYQPRFGTPREPRNRVNPGRGLVTVLDFVTGGDFRAVIFLTIAALMMFLPGFFNIPPIDRDEARFAQATKQMVETGDFVDIRFQNEVRYKKPVGIYWLQAATVEAASSLGLPRAQIRIWLYRVPSLIGAVGAVLLTYWTALAFVTRRGAVLAALLLCGSVLLGVEARLAKTDAMLLLTATAAMGALARVYLSWQRGEDPARPPWSWPIIFWTALAGGVLLKGPLIFLFVIATVGTLAVLDRSAAWLWRLRPVWGLIWLLVLVLPWFVAIFLRAGDTFFTDSVGGDMLSMLAGGQESHGAPPGIYFLLFWITFWPGAPLAGMAAPAVWRARREPGAQYLLAWLIPSWIVFEIVVTKLPHYVLPLYPAIAILIAGTLERRMLSRSWLVKGSRRRLGYRGGRGHQADPAAGLPGLAVRRGVADPGPVRVVDVRRRPRRTIAAQRGDRVAVSRHRHLRHYRARSDAAVPEPGDRPRAAQCRVRRSKGRGGRLSGAEPGFHDRNVDPADRRFRRRGLPRQGKLPLRPGRVAIGAGIRAAGSSHRPALQRVPADRRL